MGHNELLEKVKELRSLHNLADELATQIEALTDEVKAEMNNRGVDKLFLGDCKVTWTQYATTRFDTKTLKAENESLYVKYNKTIQARRFTVS